MLYPLRDRILGLVVVIASSVSTGMPAFAEDLTGMRQALNAAVRRDWTAASASAAQSGPVAEDLVLWQRLRAGQGTWAEYRDFAATHGNWPGMELFYKRGDALLRPDLPPAEVIRWFGARKPDSIIGEQAYLVALSADDPAAAKAELARFWRETPLSADDARILLSEHAAYLAPIDPARMMYLFDLGEWLPASEVLARLPADGEAAQIGKARLAMQRGQQGVDKLILAMPQKLQNDPGLILDRFRWRMKNKMGELARELMLERSTSVEALRSPEAWAKARIDFARAALRAHDWVLAEKFAANHFLPVDNKDYTDLEWIAGFAALKQRAYDRALDHFRKLETPTSTPITLSRSLYWQARTLEDQGDKGGAQALYARASAHQTAYYGQLAGEKVGAIMDPSLAVSGLGADTLPQWRGSKLIEDPLWQTGVWSVAAGYPEQGQRFFMQLAETAEPEDIGRMARLMLELRMPWNALRLAKAAAAKGGIYPAAYFPLTGLELDDHSLPPELVLSIARRESEFNHTVTSHSGAKGLMQVMPGTAKDMSKVLGEAYDFSRLTSDPAYNARLGAAYLRGLEDRFGYSTALVSSGYNAGPGRPARWIKDFGDIRRDADPVDWVEMIPLDETRNYVMRVTEAMPIYRARIHGKPAPIVPTYDLTGGGLMPPPPMPPIRLYASARPPQAMRNIVAIVAGGAAVSVLRPLINEANASGLPAAP